MNATYESRQTGRLAYDTTLKRALRALALPYGERIYLDGKAFLFASEFVPLWERQGDGPPVPADPAQRMPMAGSTDRYFYDASMTDRDANAAAYAALTDWRLPVPDPADVLRVVCRSH
jgi:hypothetical protein